MTTIITAQEIGEAWLDYVADTFQIRDGRGYPEIDEELKRLEVFEDLKQVREEKRAETDKLIDAILQCPPEKRFFLYTGSDRTTMALVYDRIQGGTQVMLQLAQRGSQINTGEESDLAEFFRRILLQKLEV
jgi:hypothetical protein